MAGSPMRFLECAKKGNGVLHRIPFPMCLKLTLSTDRSSNHLGVWMKRNVSRAMHFSSVAEMI